MDYPPLQEKKGLIVYLRHNNKIKILDGKIKYLFMKIAEFQNGPATTKISSSFSLNDLYI